MDFGVLEYLDYKLEDDESDFGGIPYVGYTLRDYLQETDLPFNIKMEDLNKMLPKSGIKPIQIQEQDMTSYDEMVEILDHVMIRRWNEYTPSDLNRVIVGLIQNHEPYMNMQPYYIDYLIEDLERLKETIK
jgi:hypothetical protein